MRQQLRKGQPPTKSFAGIPRIVMETDDFKGLHGNAVKLLLALAYQYRGKNNGDLTAAFSVMQKRFGFKNQTTLAKALKALIDAGMITQTMDASVLCSRSTGGLLMSAMASWIATLR
jgi:hypothetical protein